MMTMMIFNLENYTTFKQELLAWANRAGSCAFLDSHHYNDAYHKHDCIVGSGVTDSFQTQAGSALDQLKDWLKQNTGKWIFGHLGYGLKKETEQILTTNPDFNNFPDLYFFIPETVIKLNSNTVEIITQNDHNPRDVFNAILNTRFHSFPLPEAQVKSRVSKADYLQAIHKVKQHILRGDCYELNYCQEYYAEDYTANPIDIYIRLQQKSPTPFGCFYKVDNNYLLCASPERYVQKTGNTIISQPIKGTEPRNKQSEILDKQQIELLKNSAKNQAENVMVVDLVRNDFSKICNEGSVQVSELFGIYSFPQVHQMISTVKGEIDSELTIADIAKATFPMGSMTGAPKKRVLQIIDDLEPTARNIYSGTVGYISPNNDFDFNVVIRSIIYNTETRYLSYFVGGGITWNSIAEEEYTECMHKAAAIVGILTNKH